MSTARKSNRDAFPVTAAVVDQFRGVFGDGVKVSFVQEGNASIGKALNESEYLVIAGNDLVLKVRRDGRS